MEADVDKIWEAFGVLYPPLGEQLAKLKDAQLLAHYTSLGALEKILASEEFWLSNPLFMNDLEEVRFGVLQGGPILRDSDALREALGSPERHARFTSAFDGYFSQFDREHLFDTYVLCFSRFDPANSDGRLSMWRGYGGNGRGAALVVDATKIPLIEGSPLILSSVEYGTAEQRIKWQPVGWIGTWHENPKPQTWCRCGSVPFVLDSPARAMLL